MTKGDCIEALGALFFLLLLTSLVVVPWILQFTVAWWAGISSWIILVIVYDVLFVPEGSICMGPLFGLALLSFLVLLMFNAVELIRWAITLM